MKNDYMKSSSFQNLLDFQKRNMEVFFQPGRKFFENFQTLMEYQTKVVSQMVNNASSIFQESATEDTQQEKTTLYADLAKKSYERSVENWSQLTKAMGRSSAQASDLLEENILLSKSKNRADKGNGKSSSPHKAA